MIAASSNRKLDSTPSEPLAVVSVSGGKDSTATALLALDTCGSDHCRFVFAATGHEYDLTYEYVNIDLRASDRFHLIGSAAALQLGVRLVRMTAAATGVSE